MYRYLSYATPDCTDILSVRPQNILVQTGQKSQVIHDCDDGSVSVVGLSSASFFDVELQWDYISDADRSTIFELFHDPTKANGSARTFYWQHPIQVDGADVLYVVRFLSPLRIVYKPGLLRGIESMTLRVEGKQIL